MTTRPVEFKHIPWQLEKTPLGIQRPEGASPAGFGWKQFVTPRPLVADVIETLIKPRVIAQMPKAPVDSEPGLGWQQQLAFDSADEEHTVDAMIRRIYSAQNEEFVKVILTENIEKWLMAVGLYIDRHTTLPQLPGNRWLAADLLMIRAEMVGDKLNWTHLTELVPKTCQLVHAIILDPYNAESIMDDAPYDCFRPAQ